MLESAKTLILFLTSSKNKSNTVVDSMPISAITNQLKYFESFRNMIIKGTRANGGSIIENIKALFLNFCIVLVVIE